jgi:murein L,D-transpeptidase YafK
MKHFLLSLFCILCSVAAWSQPQHLPGHLKPKQQKVVPKYPPQFHSKDTIGRAKKIADSLALIEKKKKAIRESNFGPDTIIKILSSKVDAEGYLITEKEIRVGKKVWMSISKMPPKTNRKFSIDSINKDSIKLVVVKKNYRMYVYHKGKLLTVYKVVFGPDPFRQKAKEGDKRTPEGDFKIVLIRPHKEWHTFMLLDYPNETSWKNYKANLESGEVSKSSRIGGAIGIHSVAPGCDYFLDEPRNWTDGCIALNRKDTEELLKLCQAGTPISIKLKN